MVITSSRLANWAAAIFNHEQWTPVARTQLEFTARDHEFTSWMERSISAEYGYGTGRFLHKPVQRKQAVTANSEKKAKRDEWRRELRLEIASAATEKRCGIESLAAE